MKDLLDNTAELNKFRFAAGMRKEGVPRKCRVIVKDENEEIIFNNIIEMRIYTNQYGNLSVEFDWGQSQIILKKAGVHLEYSTRFSDMECRNEQLFISNENITIIVSEK